MSRHPSNTAPRTSLSYPLQIAEIRLGGERGRIGVTFAPGKKQPASVSGGWDRDLAADLAVIATWNAAAVVTLIEDRELKELGIKALGADVRRRHMEWHHLPIRDGDAPSASFERHWIVAGEGLRDLLRTGMNVLVHCKGGLGRAGTLAARLLAARDALTWSVHIHRLRAAVGTAPASRRAAQQR